MGCKFEPFPHRQNPEVINAAYFQLYPLKTIGSTGVKVVDLPLTFETTPEPARDA